MEGSSATVSAGNVVADVAASYDPNHTDHGRISATVDAVQVALAQKSIDMATDAMVSQFRGFNRVFNAVG
ncbi:MAG: hypothetical protein HQL32_14360 [Planctomycetes bacterium]|nr:hypothetical protein [Planctomycetota bacterium]